MKDYYQYGITDDTIALVDSYGLTLVVEQDEPQVPVYNEYDNIAFTHQEIAGFFELNSAKSTDAYILDVIKKRAASKKSTEILKSGESLFYMPYYNIGTNEVNLTSERSLHTGVLNIRGVMVLSRSAIKRKFGVDNISDMTTDMKDVAKKQIEENLQHVNANKNGKHVVIKLIGYQDAFNDYVLEKQVMVNHKSSEIINNLITQMSHKIADWVDNQWLAVRLLVDVSLFCEAGYSEVNADVIRSHIAKHIQYALGFKLPLGHGCFDPETTEFSVGVILDAVPCDEKLISHAPYDLVALMIESRKDTAGTISSTTAEMKILFHHIKGVSLNSIEMRDSDICF